MLAPPDTVVLDPDSDPPPESPCAHVAAFASGRTSMGSVPVVGDASVGRCTLTTREVVPAVTPVTMKSLVGWRRSRGADAGAFATLESPIANDAVTGAHRSGSTMSFAGRCWPGPSTRVGGSKCTTTVGAVEGSQTSPGLSVVFVSAAVDAWGDEVQPHPIRSASAAQPRRVVRFMKWATL